VLGTSRGHWGEGETHRAGRPHADARLLHRRDSSLHITRYKDANTVILRRASSTHLTTPSTTRPLTISGDATNACVAGLPSLRAAKLRLKLVMMELASPLATSVRFHCPMHGPQLLDSTCEPRINIQGHVSLTVPEFMHKKTAVSTKTVGLLLSDVGHANASCNRVYIRNEAFRALNQTQKHHTSPACRKDSPSSLISLPPPGLFRSLRKLPGMPGRLPGTFRFWPFSRPEVSLPWAENFRAWPEGRPEASNRAKRVSRYRMRLLHLPAIVYCYRQGFPFPNLVRQHSEKVRVGICQHRKIVRIPPRSFSG
jgi:hypothetical protein